jgi:hypothetical protein
MAYVQFYRLNPTTAVDETAGRVVLADNGLLRFSDDMPEWLQRVLLRDGVTDHRRKHYTVADGMAFLQALKWEYHGSYLRASDVIL